MDEVLSRSRVLSRNGSAVRLPVAHMVCNQTPPVGDKPSLMTFREVIGFAGCHPYGSLGDLEGVLSYFQLVIFVGFQFQECGCLGVSYLFPKRKKQESYVK